MKKVLIVIVVIAGLFGLMAAAGTIGMDKVRKFRLAPVDMSIIPDGEYEGKCTISRWALDVRVTVVNQKIKNIVITDRKMSNISDDLKAQYDAGIIDAEKPVFDSVSGATSITGKAYTIAVVNALINNGQEDCSCF